MHQTKKGNQWHFGMKAHIAVDADSGLVPTATPTAANEASGYRGAQARVNRKDLQWHIAARPSDIAKLPGGRRKAAAQKHGIARPACEQRSHPFRVIQASVRLAKVRFHGLAKNTAHVVTDGATTADGNGRSPSTKRMNDTQRDEGRRKQLRLNPIFGHSG